MTDAIAGRDRAASVGRFVDAWMDGWSLHGRGGRSPAAIVLLALFVLVWTTFQIVSSSSIGLHPDVVEVYAWSRHPSLGYYKHPPLNALTAFAWLKIFPATDWSFHLLAMTNAALALYAVDLISRRYLDGDKRLMVLMLLLLTPFYQFHADLFSTNQVLVSTWPIATYCFLRAFETRTLLWSVAAGAAAAAAMLGKYYSIYLLGSFAFAVLLHPAAVRYLKSPSPWISLITGFAVMAPNLYWLVTTGFLPFHYAYAVHGKIAIGQILLADLGYLIGTLGYVALPIVVYGLATRPSRQALAKALWPPDPRRRMLVVLLAGQLLLAPLSAPFVGVLLTPLWTMQACFLLPIVLLAPDEIAVSRGAARRVGILVVTIAAVVLAASPAIAWIYHVAGDKDGRGYYRLMSDEVTRQWRERTGLPLKIVRGDLNLVNAAAFYSPDHPDAVAGFDLRAAPWVTPDRLRRSGWVMICPAADRWCPDEARRSASIEPHAELREFVVTNRYLGVPGKPGRFVMLMVPPSSDAPPPARPSLPLSS